MLMPFHLAIPVTDLEEIENFYVGVLGCKISRRTKTWIDFNFFGHHVTAHLRPDELKDDRLSVVDGRVLPVRHFGVVLGWSEWHRVEERLRKTDISYISEPNLRYRGKPEEKATVVFLDPSGNAIEFKSFKRLSCVFESFEKIKQIANM